MHYTILSSVEVSLIAQILDWLRKLPHVGERGSLIYSSTVTEALLTHPNTPGTNAQMKRNHVQKEFSYKRLGGFLKANCVYLGLLPQGIRGNRQAYRLALNVSATANVEKIVHAQQATVHADANLQQSVGLVPDTLRGLNTRDWGLILDLISWELRMVTDQNNVLPTAERMAYHTKRAHTVEMFQNLENVLSDHFATLPRPSKLT